MRFRAPASAVVAALLVAACGSSSKPAASVTSSTASAPPATSTTTTTTATVTAPRTTSAAATPGGPAQCVASDLALSALGQQGGLGHGELGFALRNTSSTSCRTGGYPGVQFLDQAGRPLTTVPTRVTRDFFGATPVSRIMLAPGHSVSFRLGVTHEAQGSATCTTAPRLQVIAPNDTSTLRTTIPDGAYECQTVTVSPLRPGVTAYP